MTLLAPLAFALGVFGAAVVVGMHLLTTRRPPPQPLPTARFVPMAEARAVARTRRPTDLLLLALRTLAVLLIGAAFARPVLDAPGPRVRSVVLLDVSSTVADPAAAAALARVALGEGGALVVFDTSARVLSVDSLGVVVRETDRPRPPRGVLSPALVTASEAAAEIARGADSVRLVIISPFAEGAMDAATTALRVGWPGRAELVRVGGRSDTARGPVPELATLLRSDPLLPAIARRNNSRGSHAVWIVRHAPSARDSIWAREAGHVLVVWPAVAAAPRTADAVFVPGPWGVTLVSPLSRNPVGPPERVVARWRDGSAAATEMRSGDGCIRSVGVGVPIEGDLTLREPFARFLEAMLEPCGGRRGIALSDSIVLSLAGSGALAPARLLLRASAPDARVPVWLLALAMLALVAEWSLRRRAAR